MRKTNFRVYWEDNGTIYCMDHDNLTDHFKFTQDLRNNTSATDLAMSISDPNQVGKLGVASPDPDYAWTKRRHRQFIQGKTHP